jgi:hypothetical protein
MRKVPRELKGAPAALVMGAALATALFVVWIATRLISDWAGLPSSWSLVFMAVALLLAVVSFPVWFSFVSTAAEN